MKKHFYSHIIEIDSVFVAIDLLEMEKGEREELIAIVESSIHHIVLDTVLSELSEHDKKVFLAHVADENHDNIWSLLQEKTPRIEHKIRKGVDKFKQDLHKDIAKAKKKTVKKRSRT